MNVDVVRKIAHRLMGLGIVQETPERIDLQCSIDATRFKIDMLLRRLSVIASTIFTEALQALTDSDRQIADDAIRREDEADMMYWLSLRLLLSAQRDRTTMDKIGIQEPSHILYYGLISRYLELIGDRAEYIAHRAMEFMSRPREKTSKSIMNRILNMGELAHNVFLRAMDCVFTANIEVANDLLEISRAIRREHDSLLKELPENVVLRTIAWEIDRIADHGASVAVIAINMALEKPSNICYTEMPARA
jgi:phosphate uptake regulator